MVVPSLKLLICITVFPTFTGTFSTVGLNVQLPDGRWVVAFRDRALGSSTYGQYVAWVGSYDDLRNGRPGQYRIHLMKSWSGTQYGGWKGDTGYSGVELLPDGTILCTTYIKLFPDDRLQSVACTRFRIEETDRLAGR